MRSTSCAFNKCVQMLNIDREPAEIAETRNRVGRVLRKANERES
jgi:hypothetical protein